MSEDQQPIDRNPAPLPQNTRGGTRLAGQSASFWVASLASLGVIIGGVGPWATWMNYVSISGTSMHGWREAAVGGVALVMLGLYEQRGWRSPLIVAGIAGALGMVGAINALNNIANGGAVSVLGVTYRYMDAAWGLYLVLAGTIVLTLCASTLAWRDFRATVTGRTGARQKPVRPQS